MTSYVSRFALTAAAVGLLAACSSGTPEQTALDARLEQDLSLAAAAAVELAPKQGTEVTSALELVPQSEQVKAAPAPRQVRRAPSPTPAPERIVTPEPAPTPSPEPVMVAEAPYEEPLPIDGPGAAPRPEAPDVMPVLGPERGDGPGGWGVVIRGGLGGVDDCRLHDMQRPGRRSGVVISINERIPGVQGTFPNRISADAPRIEVSRPISRGGTMRPRGFR